MSYIIELLEKEKHIRTGFLNRHPSLQNYFRNNATSDHSNGLAKCYVLTDGSNTVIGYYTLSNISVPVLEWPPELIKKLKTSLPILPCTLLGKLAVDSNHERKGYGEALLMHAMSNASSICKRIGSVALVVDPIDQDATSFYLKYEFIQLQDNTRMYIPMKKIAEIK